MNFGDYLEVEWKNANKENLEKLLIAWEIYLRYMDLLIQQWIDKQEKIEADCKD